MAIPILMHFGNFISILSVTSEMWRNLWSQSISDSITQIFDVIQSDSALQKQVH